MENLTVEQWWTRIDVRLTQHFPYSRNFFHRLLEQELITVTNKQRPEFVPKKSYTLQTNDQVAIKSFMRYLDGGILDETPIWEIDIRHETPDYIVLRKPKGVLSHPTSIRNVNVPSVVGGVYHHYKAMAEKMPTGTAPFIRAGLVHRLDRDTDGFMIIAKTESGLAYFKSLFQKKSKAPTKEEKEAVPLKKCYRAVCELTTQGKHFLQSIKNHLPTYIEQIVIPRVPYTVPKMGITKIISFSSTDAETVTIDLEILTWRTHQIRYHLSEVWLPVVSDTLYGAKLSSLEIQLTAWKLAFVDNEGVRREFSI
jgi:23S rRNA-/tRNA-specific pseudouridylate synthase